MPRWPGLHSAPALLRSADWFGTVLFATSGSLTAAGIGMDMLGCVLVGTMTATGGGTLRDAIILAKRPFWVDEPEYVIMALVSAAAAFLVWPSLPSGNPIKTEEGGEGWAMDLGDCLGIGAFAVIGAMSGVRLALPGVVSVICGMMTATFGGLTRDTLCALPSNTHGNGRILHSEREIYATTALAGAGAYVAARKANLKLAHRIYCGFGAAFGLRIAGLQFNIGLPTWTKPHIHSPPTLKEPHKNPA